MVTARSAGPRRNRTEAARTETLQAAEIVCWRKEVALTPLYDPELDLLSNAKTGPAHHRLRLFFFAPTPPALTAGAEMVVEDRLCPKRSPRDS